MFAERAPVKLVQMYPVQMQQEQMQLVQVQRGQMQRGQIYHVQTERVQTERVQMQQGLQAACEIVIKVLRESANLAESQEARA